MLDAFLKSEPKISLENQFKLIYHEILSNTNRFNSFMTKALMKNFSMQDLNFY